MAEEVYEVLSEGGSRAELGPGAAEEARRRRRGWCRCSRCTSAGSPSPRWPRTRAAPCCWTPPPSPHSGLPPEPEKIARMSEGSMAIQVTGASLAFLSSTLTKLSEWAQDEILPTPVPMTIDVRNVAFTLTDDNPPVRGCPKPPPVDFSVPELRLVRDKSGMFTVTAAPVSSTDTTPLPVSSSAHNGQDDNVRRELELALSEVRILRARLAEKQVQITDLKTRNKTLTVSKKQSVSQVENKLFREEEVS